MNTNNLKQFAQDARRKLIEQVEAKLSYVLTADSAVLREQAQQVQQLRQELSRTTKEQLIEKVAYTWFNRFMALRFMDANDYQPIGIRVLSPKDGYTTPEILDEAKRGNVPEDLRVDRQKVFDLLDGKIPSSNPQNEAFKLLVIASCNYLNTVLPFLFEKISDYTELLLPDDLTSDFSVVSDFLNGMLDEECHEVEIIGWLYQFYISEKKDEVFASKAAVKKEDIPAATQLFTPRWIVEYMVQNTLGKLWLQNKPKSRLREFMPYFIESESLKSQDYLKVTSPEEIKFADPASGSGHILIYGFELFTKIYEEEGYNNSEIPKLIIKNNLYGFEIDERAAQLSGFALMMKAREYHRRALRKEIEPRILCYSDLTTSDADIKQTFSSLNIKVSPELLHDLNLLKQATNLGSLIIPMAHTSEIHSVIDAFNQVITKSDIFQKPLIEALLSALSQLYTLSIKFHCVVANPPYMGSRNMNKELAQYVKSNYPDSKADLMACFMESGLKVLQPRGYLGMINQHSWMFLSSYEELRKKLIDKFFIDNLLHLGARTFPEIGGEVVQNASFTIQNERFEKKGIFVRLVDYSSSEIKSEKAKEAIKNPKCGWFYTANQKDFEKIPGRPIAYWLSARFIEIFEKSQELGELLTPSNGIQTGNNEKYTRNWWSISFDKKDIKWFPYAKGGPFRKWYGNIELFVNWENDGEKILSEKNSCARGRENYLKKGITWTDITSNKLSFRFLPEGSLFDAKGPSAFGEESLSILGFLNTVIVQAISKSLNPTLSFQIGDFRKLPIYGGQVNIKREVESLIHLAKSEWDSKEISWNFKQNELVRIKGVDLIEIYDLYKQYWQNQFWLIHKYEEEINKQFIQVYGLQDELTSDVPLVDITILEEEIDRNALVKLNKKLSRDRNNIVGQNYQEISLPFISMEVIEQFISYSVGCMFGRYSLDKEGLILANQGETLEDYIHKVTKSKEQLTFIPDIDNIIPVLDDEWFEDDIVGRFYQFLKVTFGEKNFTKNLAFIEEQLGKDIRKYFTKDFYVDHIQRYKKRPIYWMFSSPKGSFNVLIYMHRYTPDTISNILNKYLREFTGKLKTRKEHLQHVMVSGSPAQKTSAIKENDKIDKMLIELQEYEREVLFPLATERIAIDLDDGILVNYNKFGKALKEVNGLNDPATKKKVKQFDWIDANQIR